MRLILFLPEMNICPQTVEVRAAAGRGFVLLVLIVPLLVPKHIKAVSTLRSGPEIINKIMLNAAEHDILKAIKYKNINKFSFFNLR